MKHTARECGKVQSEVEEYRHIWVMFREREADWVKGRKVHPGAARQQADNERPRARAYQGQSRHNEAVVAE